MSEIQPRVVYSPNGILTLGTEAIYPHKVELVEKLSEQSGIEVDNEGTINVEVKRTLGSALWHEKNGAIRDFLDAVGKLSPSYPKDTIDHVVNPQWFYSSILEYAVYPHFQRWLNTQGILSDRVAQEASLAMAVPFGRKSEQDVNRRFASSSQRARATHLEINIQSNNSDFGITKVEETDEGYIYQEGNVRWSWVNLTTIGNCACIGVDSEERKRVVVGNGGPKPWLYNMAPHNIGTSHETLSILLGLGSLAYHASQYSGQEDILEHVDWAEPKNYPETS